MPAAGLPSKPAAIDSGSLSRRARHCGSPVRVGNTLLEADGDGDLNISGTTNFGGSWSEGGVTIDTGLQPALAQAQENIQPYLEYLSRAGILRGPPAVDQIRIIGEGENETGTHISEISLYYERDI